MQPKKFCSISGAALLCLAMLLWVIPARAAHYKVLYQFRGGPDGEHPSANLVLDAAGNLYGTTHAGGSGRCEIKTGERGCGTIFKLTPNPDGTWTKTVLHNFGDPDPLEGAYPFAGLTFDAAGNLYGTTSEGGSDVGLVFKLTANPDGSWTYSPISAFYFPEGCSPYAGVIFDAAGNLYGTANAGGVYESGMVFKLSLDPDGNWTQSILHTFNGGDGAYPAAGLIFDRAGNLYSTTTEGGAYGFPGGTVFKLAPNPDGTWTESVIHSFSGEDGNTPQAGLILDAAGNLYGTAGRGGAYGAGTVFKLMPNPDGSWTEQTILSFTAPAGGPLAGLTFDNGGNLWGTANGIFKLSPDPNGSWKITAHRAFKGRDGASPRGDLTIDAAGNLYGTTYFGGRLDRCMDLGCGVVFQITP